MVIITYACVVLLATTIGATAGLGGGVIIKPLLDLIGWHSLADISFISTCTVLSMALYSVSNQLRHGIKLNWEIIIYVAFGAIIGGYLGNYLFGLLMQVLSERVVQYIQTFTLTILLIGILVNSKIKLHYEVQSKLMYLVVGILLGTVSSFVGIGGGPINVMVFMAFFAASMKEATLYSLATIIFSQLSKLISIGFTTGFLIYDYQLLYYLIPVALIGGIIGSKLNRQLSSKKIEGIFNVSVAVLIVVNIAVFIKYL